jgi:hypothetical protein
MHKFIFFFLWPKIKETFSQSVNYINDIRSKCSKFTVISRRQLTCISKTFAAHFASEVIKQKCSSRTSSHPSIISQLDDDHSSCKTIRQHTELQSGYEATVTRQDEQATFAHTQNESRQHLNPAPPMYVNVFHEIVTSQNFQVQAQLKLRFEGASVIGAVVVSAAVHKYGGFL